MKVRRTGDDEVTLTLSMSEVGLLKTCLRVAEENDGRHKTEWTQFADDLGYVLHHETCDP